MNFAKTYFESKISKIHRIILLLFFLLGIVSDSIEKGPDSEFTTFLSAIGGGGSALFQGLYMHCMPPKDNRFHELSHEIAFVLTTFGALVLLSFMIITLLGWLGLE